MHFEGTQTIRAPIERVWETLMDPNRIGPCMPGFQGVEVLDDTHFKAKVGVGIAAIKANFTMDVSMENLEPPHQATAKAHGVAPISAVDLSSRISLSNLDGGATQLQWTADVVVSGTLASLGARLMQSTAQKMTGQFFTCLTKKLEADSPTGG